MSADTFHRTPPAIDGAVVVTEEATDKPWGMLVKQEGRAARYRYLAATLAREGHPYAGRRSLVLAVVHGLAAHGFRRAIERASRREIP